jgi:hypothetical protein
MTVLNLLTDKSNSLILTNAEKISINSSISTLQSRLNFYFGDKISKQLIFGSYARETILPRSIDTQSDVDYMVLFPHNSIVKPSSSIERLIQFSNKKYSTSEIVRSHPTSVLKLNHIMFELVPAYQNIFGAYFIPAPKSNWEDWMPTDPIGFNQDINNKNKENKYLIKPLVRLIKYWNVKNGYIYESFLLEKQVVSGWYFGCNNLKDYFFKAIENLNINGLSIANTQKVNRAKSSVTKIKQYYSSGSEYSAVLELQKLLS